MLKYVIFSVFLIFFTKSNAQQLTRLVGYEETAIDSFGATMDYTAYWQNFSGNRGSTINPLVQVGFMYHDFFVDESASDTIWSVKKHFGQSAYTDSSMTITVYNNSNSPIESKIYEWDFNTSSWTSYAVQKDSFVYASNQLIAHYYFMYNASTNSLTNTETEIYTYSTNGKLTMSVKTYGTPMQNSFHKEKTEYAWAGNSMTSNKYYNLVAGNWQLQQEIATTYISQKPLTQKFTGWYDDNGTPVSYDQLYDSNIYNGNKLTAKYRHFAGYYTAMYNFNFRQSYQYDTKGNVSEMIFETIDSFGVWKNDKKLEFTYNSSNNPVLIKHYDFDKKTSSWKLAARGNITIQRYYYMTVPTSVTTTRENVQLRLYPSPAQNILYLETEFYKVTGCTFRIVDIQGKLQRQWTEYIPAGNTETSIPIGNLPDGNYFLRLYSPVGTVTKRFSVIK